MFGFFEAEDDPEVAAALLDAAAGLGPRAGPRAAARPDGLHHQRRVRAAGRGLRPRAADPAALAPALLPELIEGQGLDEVDGPADVVAQPRRADVQRRGLPPDDPRARPQGHRRARGDDPRHGQARPRGRAGPLHRGLQLGLGEELGLRPDHRGGGPRPGLGPEAGPRRGLVLHRRARRRGPRRLGDPPGLQPGDRRR